MGEEVLSFGAAEGLLCFDGVELWDVEDLLVEVDGSHCLGFLGSRFRFMRC